MLFPTQVEVSCPKEMAWKVNMYRGYLAICHPEEQQLSFIERLVEMASTDMTSNLKTHITESLNF